MGTEKKKVLAISGSAKNNSTNEAVIKIMEQLSAEHCDIKTYPILDLPFFTADSDEVPEIVKDFRDQLKAADAVIICTPEYIFSLPAVLKNAIEWSVSSSSFSGKPVALIVASSLGEKAFDSLQLIMKTIEAVFDETTTLLIQGAKSKIEKHDAHTVEQLKTVVNSLMRSI